MTGHSSIVGGSTAARVLACPGSVVANLALPRSIAISSEYAEEGTFYHEVMAALLTARQELYTEDLEKLATRWIGRRFHDRALTQHHVDEGITPALAALADLEQVTGGGHRVMAVEHKVQFPNLPGVFGTIDLILRNRDTVLHVDFKFGQGVPVYATYPVSVARGLGGAVTVEEEKVNEQLLFYTVAARHSLRRLVYEKDDKLVVAIIQPRIEGEPLSYTRVEDWELADFEKRMQKAIVTALSPEAPRHKGEHCRWAPCKVTCPLWNEPLLDLAAFNLLKPDLMPQLTSEGHDAYGKHLAHAKTLVDMAAVIKTEVDLQLHTYLANGGRVPGWRLKEKKKMRQWIDEKKVEAALKKLGFKSKEIWRRKLLTFESADALAKRRRVKIPDHLRLAPPSAETTIAQDSDPAPVVTPVIAIEQFRASLAALVGPSATLPKPETGDRRQDNG
jgi:Protein of unknown function (DUF2800)